MTGYHYDLFISYKVNPQWNDWTRKHLYKNLMAYLSDQVPWYPKIYLDEHTRTGADWVDTIGSALGRSKALVAVLNVPYFSSQWCLHELDMMHSRLLHNGLKNIIFPIVVHSCADTVIPPEIKRLQTYDLKEFRNSMLIESTEMYVQFSARVKELSSSILEAVQQPPPYEPCWELECKKRFNDLVLAKDSGLEVGVKTLTLSDPPQQNTIPRVTL